MPRLQPIVMRPWRLQRCTGDRNALITDRGKLEVSVAAIVRATPF